jgi:cyclopropane fatty-acyl-phospholipid synthase-like methyltransferase
MFKNILARQFRRPSGLLGLFAANFMKKNNQDYFARVCDLLNLQDSDKILEIGCGAGYAIRLIAEKNSTCTVDALDFSTMMLKKAKRINRDAINAGRVRLFKGDFGEYDFSGNAYSKIVAINVIYFWNDLLLKFSKIYCLLKPGGRFILFMSSPERLAQVPFAVDEVFTKYTLQQVETDLHRAGFPNVTHEKVLKKGFETYYICAEKQ